MASEKPNVSEVKNFDHGKLKHVQTSEKNTLPSDESKIFTCDSLVSVFRVIAFIDHRGYTGVHAISLGL